MREIGAAERASHITAAGIFGDRPPGGPGQSRDDPDPDFRAAAARKSLVDSAPWRLNPFSVLPAVVDDARGRTVDDNGDENGGRGEGGVVLGDEGEATKRANKSRRRSVGR